MPCNCDYMNPTQFELEISRVLAFIDEVVIRKTLNKNHYDGYHPVVYGKGLPKPIADHYTSLLCGYLQKEKDLSRFSLELQVWWRDHQEADKKRVQEEIKKKKTDAEKETALAKLTSYEKKLLGL